MPLRTKSYSGRTLFKKVYSPPAEGLSRYFRFFYLPKFDYHDLSVGITKTNTVFKGTVTGKKKIRRSKMN